MKAPIFLILLAFCQLSCKAQIISPNNLDKILQGIYKQKGSSEKLELKSDGSYVLYNPEDNGYFVIEQCNYSSKGKWKQMSNDVIEITSENYYQQQEGFKYELKKENKLSQDSLYIKVQFPSDFHPVKLGLYFNNNVDKGVHTDSTFIKLSKSKYLWPKTSNSINRNHIAFSLNANISETTLYKGRIMFKIFEEDIDTEKYNYLTITLPHFDLCFFEFELYNQELLFIRNQNELIWQGKSWDKLH